MTECGPPFADGQRDGDGRKRGDPACGKQGFCKLKTFFSVTQMTPVITTKETWGICTPIASCGRPNCVRWRRGRPYRHWWATASAVVLDTGTCARYPSHKSFGGRTAPPQPLKLINDFRIGFQLLTLCFRPLRICLLKCVSSTFL